MTLTYESVNKDGDEDGDLKEVFRPMLPHVPMEVRASIVEDLCEDVEDERHGGLVTKILHKLLLHTNLKSWSL